MKSFNSIDKKVQETLDSLGKIQRVEGNPYLYTRIKAQLEQEAPAPFWTFVRVASFGMVACLLILNSLFIRQQWQTYYGEDAVINALSDEYQLEESGDAFYPM